MQASAGRQTGTNHLHADEFGLRPGQRYDGGIPFSRECELFFFVIILSGPVRS
jgi:hypothetical protein